MYDDELDMALESAYDDGYVQALIDMGVNPDDIAEEDVDIYDDYDEAMESNRYNKALKNALYQSAADRSGVDLADVRAHVRNGSSWDRNVGRRTPSAGREGRLYGHTRGRTTRERIRNLELDDAKGIAQTIRQKSENEYRRMKKGKPLTPDEERKFQKAEAARFHRSI